MKISKLYQKGWQSSCHLITGRNVKDLSLQNVLPHIDLVGKFIPKGVAFQPPHTNRYKCKGFMTGKCFTSYCFSTKNTS